MDSALTATIVRDAYGAPHIFAKTEAAALYGFGYAQAEDRLPTLLGHYLAARGESAAILGAAALEKDSAARAFRIPEMAAARYADLPAEVREGIEAFVDGVNRYGQDHPEKRPAWAFDVTAQDVVALSLLYNLFFATDHFEVDPSQRGSNGFAVAGKRTASGNSIVSLDPHLPFDGPLRWYEARLSGGAMNVYGVTFAGLPYIVMGCNGRVAWANTVNSPDLSDLYEIRLVMEPGQPPQYEYDGERRPCEVNEYTFRVRQPEGGMRTFTQTILSTHHGPILREAEGRKYAMRKAGVGDVHVLTQVRQQCLAQNVDEYRAALGACHMVMFNHVFGDTGGRIGYVSAGQVPRRPDGYDFNRAVPGWTSATEWQAPLTIDELPQAVDPENGWVQNANDSPAYCGAVPLQVPPPYPVWLAPDVRTLRGERLRELLDPVAGLTPEQAMALATDTHDLNAVKQLPALLRAAQENAELSPDLVTAIAVLSAWDGELRNDSQGAALFQAWLMQPAIAARLSVGNWIAPDDAGIPPVATSDPASAVVALSDAVQWLSSYGFPPEVPWGKLHRLRRGRVNLPMDGGLDSLCPNGGQVSDTDGTMTVSFGSSYRCIAELDTAAPRLWACLPWGNSDDPSSPHYADQLPLAAFRGYRPVPWTREAIEAEATATVTL